jgi:NAD(P)-dependent dehydrogenase (short-subunit alcohol dehydrogenase family)
MKIGGHAALVTGGASGLGEATARALAAAGARVAIFDHNRDGAVRVADEIGGVGIACDVSSADSAEAAFAEALDAVGPARILVNCAGVAPAQKVLGKSGVMALADFRRVVDINLIGTFNVLRLFADAASRLDPLESDERGVAVNTASVAGFEGQVGQTAYAASKAGRCRRRASLPSPESASARSRRASSRPRC